MVGECFHQQQPHMHTCGGLPSQASSPSREGRAQDSHDGGRGGARLRGLCSELDHTPVPMMGLIVSAANVDRPSNGRPPPPPPPSPPPTPLPPPELAVEPPAAPRRPSAACREASMALPRPAPMRPRSAGGGACVRGWGGEGCRGREWGWGVGGGVGGRCRHPHGHFAQVTTPLLGDGQASAVTPTCVQPAKNPPAPPASRPAPSPPHLPARSVVPPPRAPRSH